MNITKIQWTDFTANPIKYRDRDGLAAWACVKVSAGCANCYAEALAKRYKRGGAFTVGNMATVAPYLDDKELNAMLRSPRLTGKRVFVGDMTDVFGEWVPDEMLDRMFAVFALRPDVIWQVLTKRPERMREYIDVRGAQYDTMHCRIEAAADDLAGVDGIITRGWPLPNVWLGVSVEDQAAADSRIPELLATPAAVRFLSCEPLLGPVMLTPWIADMSGWGTYTDERGRKHIAGPGPQTAPGGLSWVIAGGESGTGARPCDLAWIRSIVAQCRAASAPVFCKQGGSSNACRHDRKGGHFECFPDDLQVREWPEDLRVREWPG